MALDNWTLASSATANDQLPIYKYKILKDTRGSFSVSNPGNSGWSITYAVGWQSASVSSSSGVDSSTNNLQNFLSDVLGYAYVTGTPGGFGSPASMYRILPQQHYDVPLLYAVSAQVEGGLGTPSTSANGGIVYPTAKVTVEFKPLDYAIKTDAEVDGDGGSESMRYCSRQFGLDSQYLTISQFNMRYVTQPTQILQTQPGKITNALTFDVTWHQVPALPGDPFMIPNLAAINACAGMVNSDNFDRQNLNYPPGTVLFLGLDPKMTLPCLGGSDALAAGVTTNGGLYYWEIVMKFLLRFNGYYTYSGRLAHDIPVGTPIGHNFVYRTAPIGQGLPLPMWDYVSADGTYPGIPIYQSQDLNQLFTITG